MLRLWVNYCILFGRIVIYFKRHFFDSMEMFFFLYFALLLKNLLGFLVSSWLQRRDTTGSLGILRDSSEIYLSNSSCICHILLNEYQSVWKIWDFHFNDRIRFLILSFLLATFDTKFSQIGMGFFELISTLSWCGRSLNCYVTLIFWLLIKRRHGLRQSETRLSSRPQRASQIDANNDQ